MIQVNISKENCPLCGDKLSSKATERYCRIVGERRGPILKASYRGYVDLLEKRRPGESVPICAACYDSSEFCHRCNFPYLQDAAALESVSGAKECELDHICEECK